MTLPATEPRPTARVPGRCEARSVASRDEWPASPLEAAGRAFDVLTTPPTPLAFDGTGLAGLPQHTIDLPSLRRVLLSPSLSPAQRDAVWRAVVSRAREDVAPTRVWAMLAVGLALPGLIRVAGRLARGWPGDVADLDAEVLAGFLLRLQTLDLNGPRVLGRLLDAATRAGRRARADLGEGSWVRVDESWSAPPTQPWAHPDWVLARAVAAGVLDRTEACLIGATRLEDARVADVAQALGVTVATALAWRKIAEQRLADAISRVDRWRDRPHDKDLSAGRGTCLSRVAARVGKACPGLLGVRAVQRSGWRRPRTGRVTAQASPGPPPATGPGHRRGASRRSGPLPRPRERSKPPSLPPATPVTPPHAQPAPTAPGGRRR